MDTSQAWTTEPTIITSLFFNMGSSNKSSNDGNGEVGYCHASLKISTGVLQICAITPSPPKGILYTHPTLHFPTPPRNSLLSDFISICSISEVLA